MLIIYQHFISVSYTLIYRFFFKLSYYLILPKLIQSIKNLIGKKNKSKFYRVICNLTSPRGFLIIIFFLTLTPYRKIYEGKINIGRNLMVSVQDWRTCESQWCKTKWVETFRLERSKGLPERGLSRSSSPLMSSLRMLVFLRRVSIENGSWRDPCYRR